MGEPSPYKTGVFDSQESDLEDDSDDDLIVEEMSEERLNSNVTEMVKQIFESSYTVEVALINLKQIKHGYSKDNFHCTNAIYPAMLNYVALNLLKPGQAMKEKKLQLESMLEKYLEMFTTFVCSEQEQGNAIYQTASIFAKQESLKNVFHLFMQLCY